MTLRSYPRRLLIASIVSSLAALGVCVLLSVHLYQEQSRTAAILRENVDSRKVAAALEVALEDLVVLHQQGSNEIQPVLQRAEALLVEMHRYADKESEQQLADATDRSFREYLRLLANVASTGSTPLIDHLEFDTLPLCRRVRDFNVHEIEESEKEHSRTLRRMEWGLAVVGGLGSLGGLVLGYSLARGLRRTIHDLLVRVQGASELLAQEVPAVEWQLTGEPIGDGIDDLLLRVESVVRKLQDREREVRRAERLAAVGQLAAGIAHEIRNPLTSASLLIETARKDPTVGGLNDEDLDLVEQELHRMEQSLQKLLDYARPPTLRRSTFDLTEVVREVLSLTRGRVSQQRVDVRFDAPTTACTVFADRDQLRQVVLNLVLNALDVMPRGGTLSLKVKPSVNGTVVEMTVADTGPGIAPDLVSRLFEPFASGKETGLGLGLAVSKRIIEDHDGSAEGFNLPEGGACFVVRLPRGD